MQTQNNAMDVTKEEERTLYVTEHFTGARRADVTRYVTGNGMEVLGS
jgi:hypothetical protein